MKEKVIIEFPEPTIGGSFKYGWQQMWKYFLYLFLISIIVAIAEFPMFTFNIHDDHNLISTPLLVILSIMGVAYGLLLLPVINYGADLLFLRAIRNEEVRIKEMFDGFNNYLNIILAHLLTVAVIGLGFVFFIIPGIIIACRLVFVPYLVMDKKLDAIPAVEKSWQMTRGHGWKIFGMALLSILLFILGFILMFVGAVFAVIWIGTAFTSLYHAIDREETEALDQNGVAEQPA
ncbi:glycerophosphoryl diester phosphodiesterase membrane domain-containing protein [Bacteroidota bacterium]